MEMIAATAKSTTRQNGGHQRVLANGPAVQEQRCSRGRDVEAEHRSALVMLGDVAVRHPDAWVVASSRMSTLSPVRTSTVSFQTKFFSVTPSRARTTKRPAPSMWKGWCIGWSESISFTSRSLTWSPTRKRQSIAWSAAPVCRSMKLQCMLAGVVIRLTSTMSSSHSIPPASAWQCSCP